MQCKLANEAWQMQYSCMWSWKMVLFATSLQGHVSASRSYQQGQAKTTCQVKQQREVPAMSSCPLWLHSPAPSGGVSSAASQLLKWLLALAAPDEEPSPALAIDATHISFMPPTHKYFQEGLELCQRILIFTFGDLLLRLCTAIYQETHVSV